MSTVAKILAFVVAVAAIAFASAAFVMVQKTQNYSLALEQEKTARALEKKGLDEKITTLTQQLTAAEKTAAENVEKTKTAQEELGAVQIDREKIKGELARAQQTNDQLGASVKKIEDQLKTLSDKNKTLTDEKETYRTTSEEATTAKNKAQDELRICQEDLAQANKKIEQLTDQIKEKEGVISAYHQEVPEVSFQAPVPTEPDITGKVSKADNEKGIVMISVGKDDGVKEGFTFEVFRPGQYVGRVWVKEVFDERAICTIDRTMTKTQIMENDNVATKLP